MSVHDEMEAQHLNLQRAEVIEAAEQLRRDARFWNSRHPAEDAIDTCDNLVRIARAIPEAKCGSRSGSQA